MRGSDLHQYLPFQLLLHLSLFNEALKPNKLGDGCIKIVIKEIQSKAQHAKNAADNSAYHNYIWNLIAKAQAE